MRKAWIRVEDTGGSRLFRLISESTLFPGKAQPHAVAFGSHRCAAEAARTHDLTLTGEPLTLPLVTAQDRDQYRFDAQRRAEQALNRERGLSDKTDTTNVVLLRRTA